MKKNSVKQCLMKIIIFVLCLFTFATTIYNPISLKTTPTYSCSTVSSFTLPRLGDIIKSLFKTKNQDQDVPAEKVYVYVGGFPLGFTLSCSGVVVIAISNNSAKGKIKEGDIITKINGEEVSSAEQILLLINTEKFAGSDLELTFSRDGVENKTTITPIYDETQKIYKLGIWIRDNAAGVGTLTYIRQDNLRFGALGHPVCDIDTGAMMPVSSGKIFKCNVVGYKKGEKGKPGELKGIFLKNSSTLGSLDQNNKFGVYGNFDEDFAENYNLDLVEVAHRSEVKSGKATIRCTIDGTTPKDYEIEIVKTYFQSTKDNKSMFIRVTDKELLSKTGGIVQGMSGSPILQNGKLVGAVTHVFVSDPTKGYGVYADWMIDN